MSRGLARPIVTLAEAQAYVRVETGEEEALIAGLIRTASGLCEAFIDQVVISRDFAVELPVSGRWERLSVAPIKAIAEVSLVDSANIATVLPSDAYAVDIDSSGEGWVRVLQAAGSTRIRISCTAGLSDGQNGVPEAIRQGVLRLVGHLFADRDGAGGEPPAAVTALWRPYRRMRMA